MKISIRTTMINVHIQITNNFNDGTINNSANQQKTTTDLYFVHNNLNVCIFRIS